MAQALAQGSAFWLVSSDTKIMKRFLKIAPFTLFSSFFSLVFKCREAEPTPESATNAEEDPLVAMAAQLEDIRSRGQRLQQE
ncbi:MAG: hypothetical protein IKI31_05230, partial [Treponema sp.]|nr:hypothetical protein [Treponema sp.]